MQRCYLPNPTHQLCQMIHSVLWACMASSPKTKFQRYSYTYCKPILRCIFFLCGFDCLCVKSSASDSFALVSCFFCDMISASVLLLWQQRRLLARMELPLKVLKVVSVSVCFVHKTNTNKTQLGLLQGLPSS